MIRNVTLALFGLTFYLLFYFNNQHEWFMMNETIGVMHFVALAIIGFALSLSLVFHRSRLFFVLLVLVGFSFLAELFEYLRHNHSGLAYRSSVGVLFDMYVVTIAPLFIVIISFLKDRGVITLLGWTRTFVITVLWLGFVYFLIAQVGFVHWMRTYDFLPFDLLGMSDISLSLLIISVMLFALRAYFKPQPTEYIYLLAIFGVVTVVVLPKTLDHFIIMTTIIALLIVIDIISRSYYMAYIDELTELKGRRAMNEALVKLGSQYTLVMGDIDHFKKFNDTYGHDTGDEVLKLVASEIAKVKGGGEAYRWGGEEFVLLFPGKEAAETVPFVEKVRVGIEKHPFFIRDKNRPDEKPEKVKKRITSPKKVQITMSFGIASKSKSDQTPEEVMKKADIKLYAAKEAGRNCVIH